MSEVQYKNIKKNFGSVEVLKNINLKIDNQKFVVLLGPSGCGKTTLLRMTAGLESISSGDISIEGNVINNIHPRDRDIAMVFQNYALYPQMNVFDNIAFSLQIRKLDPQEIKKKVEWAASVLNLTEYLMRTPKELSGGQRQRVAMGRAIVRNPKAFLFDEPLSNLDAKLRGQVRIEIKKLQKQMGVTSVFVTHDQVEAMTLGDRLAVINEGVIEQVGSPIEVYEKPATHFVAEFIGTPQMNFINGKVHSNKFISDGFECSINKDLNDQEVIFGIRPENLKVSTNGSIKIKVDLIEKLGADSIIYGYDKSNNYLCYRENGNTKIKANDEISLEIEDENYHLFDKETKKRLN